MAFSMNRVTISGRISGSMMVIEPEYWYATLSSGNQDTFTGIDVDSDDNIYAAGRTGATTRVLVAKYTPGGTPVWQKQLSGLDCSARGISIDGSNGIYIGGQVLSGTTGALTVKIDTAGEILWQNKFYGSNTTIGNSISATSAGNSYTAGNMSTGPIGGTDGFIIGYNSSGTKLWNRQIGTASADTLSGVTTDSSGNIYITGDSYGVGPSAPNLTLAKYDSSGASTWARYLSGDVVDGGQSVIVDTSGNVYITGYTYQTGVNYEFFLAKFNSSGTFQWIRSSGNSGNDFGNSLALDSSDNIYVAGHAAASPDSILLQKFGPSGSIVWQRSISGTGALSGLRANGICINSAGDLCIGGTSNANADAFLIKLPSDGTLTGTYGNLTYAATSYTINTPSVTTGTASLTTNTTSYTPTTPSLTSGTTTLTNATVSIA